TYPLFYRIRRHNFAGKRNKSIEISDPDFSITITRIKTCLHKTFRHDFYLLERSVSKYFLSKSFILLRKGAITNPRQQQKQNIIFDCISHCSKHSIFCWKDYKPYYPSFYLA